MPDDDLPRCPRLIARALRPLPPQPLGLALSALSRRLSARHAGLLRRMGDYADHAVLIDPTDLPFVLRLEPAAGPRLTAHRRGDAPAAAARIAGPLSALTGMMHGRYDGDALFFSRDLVIEGDTEVVAFSGPVAPEGECEAARLRAQLQETARAQTSAGTVRLEVDGTDLDSLLGLAPLALGPAEDRSSTATTSPAPSAIRSP